MKRIILLFMIIFLTGCSVKVLDNNSDSIVNTIKDSKIGYYNKIGLGYKYYLPKGMKVIDNTSYNEVLYSNNYNYYLFVDTISYYYKTNTEFVDNSNIYYSKKLDNGYIVIKNDEKDKYLIRYFYNYASMEVKVLKKDINEALTNMSYLLFNIKYNDNIINMLKDNKITSTREKLFKLQQPKEKSNANYLDYKGINVKGNSNFEDIIDSDIIKIIED